MNEVTKAWEWVPLGGMLKRRAASTLLHNGTRAATQREVASSHSLSHNSKRLPASSTSPLRRRAAEWQVWVPLQGHALVLFRFL